MMAARRKRGRRIISTSKPGEIIRKVRKPLAPPVRIEDDDRKYKRSRERERVRRGEDESDPT
jgi:hypothetical protein